MKKRNFTLVELLVTIAVIAILAGLFLPALNRARETALQTQCINQMKTMTLAAFIYADNNNGTLMTVRNGSLASVLDATWSANRAYLDIAKISYNRTGGDGKWSHFWKAKQGCPILAKFADESGTIIGPRYYAMQNRKGIGNNDDYSVLNSIILARDVFSPSAKAFLIETLQAPDGCGVNREESTLRAIYLKFMDVRAEDSNPVGDSRPYLAYRHNNNSNTVFSFYDGHVASLKEGAARIHSGVRFTPRMYWLSK